MMLLDLITRLEQDMACRAGCALYDADSGEMLTSYQEELIFKSASLIKTPIMLCALEEVEKGALTLDTPIPVEDRHCVGDHEPVIKDGRDVTLRVLLEYMITDSNNTATNVLIDYLTMEKVNALCARLNLKHTALRRHMLDYASAREGRENLTSARDMVRLYGMLHKQENLSPFVCETALPILSRQHDKELIMNDNPAVRAAHKTGGLSDIAHDAGILYGENRTLLFAMLCTGPDDPTCVRFLQALSPHVLALM